MGNYSDEFFAALGAWQNGWGDNHERKLGIQARLEAAIAGQSLPEAAKRVDAICYRKRFLVPNNKINGGDFLPLFIDGEIDEGMASWSTDVEFLIRGDFKKEPRVGTTATIFWCRPSAGEVVLNISALYSDSGFLTECDAYIAAQKESFGALGIIRDAQTEIILSAPVSIERVTAIAGRKSTPEHLTAFLGLDQSYEDTMSDMMVQANETPGVVHWIKGEGVDRAVDRALEAAKQWLAELGFHPIKP